MSGTFKEQQVGWEGWSGRARGRRALHEVRGLIGARWRRAGQAMTKTLFFNSDGKTQEDFENSSDMI